jgi:hypothetical protein
MFDLTANSLTLALGGRMNPPGSCQTGVSQRRKPTAAGLRAGWTVLLSGSAQLTLKIIILEAGGMSEFETGLARSPVGPGWSAIRK